MVAVTSCAIALFLVWYVSRLAGYVAEISERLRSAQAAFEQISALPPLPEGFLPPALEGRQIALCIVQDHKLPVLVSLVKERLEADDARVLIWSEQESERLPTKWQPNEGMPDVLVRGAVQCNEYRDVYYHADLTLLFSQGTVGSILETPPNGARQENLAIAVVKQIKQTLDQERRRSERRSALDELR